MNTSFVALHKFSYYRTLMLVYGGNFLCCISMYLFGWFGPLSEDAGNVLQYLFVETFFNPIDLAFIVPLVTGGIFFAYYYLKRRNIHGDEMLMIDYVLFKGIYLCAIIVLTICLFIVFSLMPSGTTSLLRLLVSILYLPVIFQFAYVVYQHHDAHNRIDLPKYKDEANE